jgi:ribosome biogenesis GTPase / thiamine phosphate phosphatase
MGVSREDRKLRKHFEERAKREMRLAKKLQAKLDSGRRAPRDLSAAAGIVVETGPGFCDVLSGRERVRCRSDVGVAIGDQVLFSAQRRRIEEILPRRTVLSRADPHNPRLERVIAANVDLVVHVVSLKDPPLRPGLIDRFLIAAEKSGAAPLICLNKVDLLESADELELLRPYENAGVPVIHCSAATGAGIDQLAGALAGRCSVFAGHSGVGKSSLLNALDPGARARMGAVSAATGKGRHTTTASVLFQLPNGARVIDTPGIREFGLWSIGPADVRRYYHDFDGYLCAFPDCSHIHEPACAVKAAVESGEVARARYETYVRIVESVAAPDW